MAKIKDGSTYLGHHLSSNDYYSEKETVIGHWQGRGAELLQLSGPIEAGDRAFEALRNNRHPGSEEKLTPRDGEGRVRFFDFQCSAQKSVSILAVTMGDQRLLDAHDRAAKLAFGELERFAATQANSVFTRENRNTGNVVAAVFRHTASRALDPQVHTHHVVANATRDQHTQSWRALTEFEMVRAIRYAGKVYQNEMARACLSLGYEIESTKDEKGRITGFEINGVAKEIRERFSKRRAEVEAGIEAFRQKHGREPSVAEVHAITVSTRNQKLSEITTPAVLQAQRAQLSSEELHTLVSIKEGSEGRAAGSVEKPMLSRERESLWYATGHLFERRSVVMGHEVLAEGLNSGLGYADLNELKRHAENSSLIRIGSSPWLRSPLVTQKGLNQEKWAVEFVASTKGRFQALGQADRKGMRSLSDEQFRAVSEVLECKDQFVCLRGAAGVGKTTMVKAMQEPLGQDGRAVFFCAPMSSAAETLRKDGITRATTVPDFLQNVAIRERAQLERAVFVVDEAGLSSNTQGAAIMKLAERCNARVLFLGDTKQHTSVEAGDFLRILEAHSPLRRIEVTDIRRQTHAAYRDAVKLMAAGSSRAGLEHLDELGWIKEGKANYLQEAVSEYVRHADRPEALKQVLAVTPTWAENRAFTEQLRHTLKERGILSGGAEVHCHESLQWTRAQKMRTESYAPGLFVRPSSKLPGFTPGHTYQVVRVDGKGVWLKTERGERKLPIRRGDFDVLQCKTKEICTGERLLVMANDRKQGLVNGEILTVKQVGAGVIETAEGKRIETAAFSSLGYGYAVTSHKSQSKTVDHVIVAAERLDSKAAYVACSRGRHSCVIHTPDKASLLGRLPEGNRTAALDLLHGAKPSESCVRDDPAKEDIQRAERGKTQQQRRRHHEWLRALMRGIREWWLPGRDLGRVDAEPSMKRPTQRDNR